MDFLENTIAEGGVNPGLKSITCANLGIICIFLGRGSKVFITYSKVCTTPKLLKDFSLKG